jgi:hypothetical protein
MIWHIFKKDLKILWPFALLVAVFHSATLALAVMGGITGNPQNPAVTLLRNLVFAGPLASGLLIAAAVHLDAIPGLRQDWLVRPIRRRDLMLAKLLFAALAVQSPILIVNAAAFLIGGFSPLSSLNNAAQHSLLQMLAINVPFVALASITRNLLELVSGAFALGCIYVIPVVLLTPGGAVIDVEPVIRSGLGWTLYLSAAFIAFVGAALVLWFQYFSRRTKRSWVLAGCVTVCFILAWALPWRFVFSMQRLLQKDPVSSQAITLKFDPEAGRFHTPSGGVTAEDARDILLRENRPDLAVTIPVYLPVSVAGLPPDSAIQMDHAEVRITANGRVEELPQQPWNVLREGTATASNIIYPVIPIPTTIYDRIKDQPVRVEIDNWLTLVRVATTQALPALGGAQESADGGRCQTSVNDQQTAVQYICSGGAPLPCFHSFLEHLPSNERNPDRFACGPYASFAGELESLRTLFPARLMPSIVNLPFRDSIGVAHFPIDGPKLRDSRAVLQLYRAQDHFMRTLVIPAVRLADWEAGASRT